MNQTTIVVQIILALISSGVVSGVVTYFIRRDSNQLKVRLAEIEVRRENAARDDANLNTALTFAATLVTTFEPLKTTLDNQLKLTENLLSISQQNFSQFWEKTNEMHQVVERRDRESAEDRQTRDVQHAVIVARLDTQQAAIEEITKHITVNSENFLRHDISKILLRSAEIVQLVKALKPPSEPPGETNAPDQTTIEKAAEPSTERQEGISNGKPTQES